MTTGPNPPHRRRTTAIAAAAAFAVAIPLTAGAPALADATFPSPEGNTNIASITTYADLIRDANRRDLLTVLDSDGEPLRLGIEAEPWLVAPNPLTGATGRRAALVKPVPAA